MSCSDTQNWALPQNALGEIVTLASEEEQPPTQLSWRGRQLPVLNLADADCGPWRDTRSRTGILAVILGLRGDENGDCWAVALRGGLLTVQSMEESDLDDAPDDKLENSTAAFRYRDRVFQVPDLQAWQAALDPITEEVA